MSSSTGEEELDDEEFIVDIDGIQAHGVGAADIIKLKANGYYTVTVSGRHVPVAPD
ncbi:Meiotic recombination protein dmc1 [Xylographa pallens]|nr:Meiotic recombination protein dmc1 [Xylographa pallens]